MYSKKIAFAILVLLLASVASAEIDFRSDQPIDFYNDIILQQDNNLDLNNNEIQRFFDNACPDGQAIVNIDSNGTFECSTAAGNPGLPTILDNGNTANQKINMGEYRLTKLGAPEGNKDAVRLQDVEGEYVNVSGDTLDGDLYLQDNDIVNPGEIRTEGGGSDIIAIRDVNNSQDIARFKEGGNVKVPNGDLKVTNNNDIIAKESDARFLKFNPGKPSKILWDNNDNLEFKQESNLGGSETSSRLSITNSGNVKIPSGNLNMSNNNITNTECLGDEC